MHKPKPISNLFLRFISMFLIVILVPMLTLNFFIYKYYLGYMEDALEKDSIIALEQVQRSHETYAKQMESILQQMILSNTFTDFDLKVSPEKAVHLVDELKIMLQTHSFLGDIVLHFPGDDYVYTGSGSCNLTLFQQQAWVNPEIYTEELWQEILEIQNSFVIPMHTVTGFQRQSDYLCYCYPLPVQNSTRSAVVMFCVPMETYKSIFQNVDTQYCNTYIEQNGTILVQEDHISIPEDLIQQLPSMEQPTQSLHSGQEEYLVAQVHGTYSGTTYYRIYSLKEIYQPLYQARHLFIGLNIVILLLCGILMFYFSSISYHPIKTLLGLLEAVRPEGTAAHQDEWAKLMDGFHYVYEQNRSLHLKFDETQKARQSMLLLDFIKGRFSNKDTMLSLCQEVNLDMEYTYFSLMLIRFHARSSLSPIDNELLDILNHSYPDVQLYSTELLSSDTIAVAFFFDEEEKQKECREALWKKLLEAGFQGTAAVSESYSDISNAPKTFIEASTALTFRHVKQNEMICFADIQAEKESFENYPFGLLDEFQRAIGQNQPDSIENLVDKLIQSIESKGFSQIVSHSILKDIADILMKRAIELKIDSAQLYHLHSQVQIIESETELIRFGETVKKVCHEFSEILEKRSALPESDPDDVMISIIQYINAHCLSFDFSLYHVAEHFGMSPSQLTGCFKASLNISPMVYITNYKIRQAKFLLSETDQSIGEVCSQLGYSDVSSFIRKFKQITGKTPAAYRKENTKS